MPRRSTRVRSHVRHTAQGRVVVDAHARNLADGTRNRAAKVSTVGYTREGYPVYGSAYAKTYQGPFLTHSINRDLEKSLCRRVRFEHVINDDGDAEPEPSCPVCRARLGLPEKGANQARGGSSSMEGMSKFNAQAKRAHALIAKMAKGERNETQVSNAISRLYDLGNAPEIRGEPTNAARRDDVIQRLQALRAEATAAGAQARDASYRTEHARLVQAEREGKPAPGSYKHELAMMRNRAPGLTKNERAEHDTLTANILRDGAYDDGGRHYQPTKLQAQRLASEAMRYERWSDRQRGDTHARDEGEMNEASGFHPKARTLQLARGLSHQEAYRSVPAGQDFRGFMYNPATGKARVI